MASVETISQGLARSVRTEVLELNRRIAKLDKERKDLVERRDMLLNQRLRDFRVAGINFPKDFDAFDRLLSDLHKADAR